jgi:hypothetical protein
MKKLLLILSVFVSLLATAQTPVPFSSLTLYTGNLDSVKYVGIIKSGNVWANRVFYGIDLVKNRLLIADTSGMLAPYARAFNYYTIAASDARFELLASKATSLASPDNTKYPTTLAVVNAIPTNNNQLTNGSGYITSNQSISFAPTGDVTGSTSGTTTLAPALTIGSNKVTNAMLAQMAAHTYRGNNTGSTANAADITSTQLTADLNLFTSTLQGLVPAPATVTGKFLKDDGTWATIGGSGTVTNFSAGDLSPLFTTTETNTTTTPALSFTLSNAAAHTFFGNNTGSSGAPAFSAINEADVTSLTTDLSNKQAITTAATGLTAAGTTQGTALALSGNNSTQEVTTAASGTGVKLPTASATSVVTIINRGANSITVYPATSGIINGQSANTGYTLPSNSSAVFIGKDGTSWYTENAFTGGDVNTTDGSAVLTIGAGKVTLAMQANLAANSIMGNNTGSAATPIALTAAQVKTLLALNNVENTALSTWAGSTSLVTLGTVTTGTWSATAIAETKGGTNQTTYTLGDILYSSASNTLSKLAGNTTSAKQFLTMTGTGTVAAAPVWSTVTSTDVGLGNVENTALSTWAGSTSLTTFANNAVSYAEMQDISATQKVLGRNTAGAGDPEEVTASQVLDWISSTQGAVLYRGASGWVALAVGTDGQVLTTHGASANPTWTTAAGSGDMVLASVQTVTGAKTFNAGTLILAAGSTTAAQINFAAGTPKTTPARGDMEVDANGILMYTPNSGGTSTTYERGYMPAMQYVSNTSTVTLTVQTANQAVFGSTMDQINLSVNTTYRFYAKYYGTKTSAASTGAVKVGFAFAGTLGSIAYTSKGNVGTVNGANGSSQEVYWTTLAGGNATNTTASTPNWWLEVSGEIRVGATGGLFTPQVGLSSTTGTTAWNTDINSFIEIWPVGSNTVTIIGSGQ